MHTKHTYENVFLAECSQVERVVLFFAPLKRTEKPNDLHNIDTDVAYN